MIADFDQMMKCDMCTDRTSRRTQADVRIGVPESGAVVRHDRGVRRHPPRIAAARLSVRPPGGPHEGVHRRRRRCRRSARRRRRRARRPGSTIPSASTSGTTRRERRAGARASALAPRLPVRGRSRGRGDQTRVHPLSRARRRGDGRRQRRDRRVDATSLDQHGRGPTDRGPRRRPGRSDVPVPLSERGRPRGVAAPRRPRRRGVQPEVHASRLRRLLRSRARPLALPVPRGQLRDALRGGSSPVRRRDRSDGSKSSSATTTRSGRSAGRCEETR